MSEGFSAKKVYVPVLASGFISIFFLWKHLGLFVHFVSDTVGSTIELLCSCFIFCLI